MAMFSHFLPMCAALLVICIYILSYSYSYIHSEKILIPQYAHTYICTCIVTSRIQPHLFWVAAGYVRACSRAHDITSQRLHWLVSMCVGMMEHSFIITLVI